MDIIDRLSDVKEALTVSTHLREIIDEAIDEIIRLREQVQGKVSSIEFNTCLIAEQFYKVTLIWTEKPDRWEGRRLGSETIIAEVPR